MGRIASSLKLDPYEGLKVKIHLSAALILNILLLLFMESQKNLFEWPFIMNLK